MLKKICEIHNTYIQLGPIKSADSHIYVTKSLTGWGTLAHNRLEMIPKIWTQGKKHQLAGQVQTGWELDTICPGEQVWQMPSFHDKLITRFLPRLVMSYRLLSSTSVQHSASSHLTDDVLSGDGRKFWKFLGAMWHMRWLDSTSGNFWQLEDDDADGDSDGLTLLVLFSTLIVF